MALGMGLTALLGGQISEAMAGFTLADLKLSCAVCAAGAHIRGDADGASVGLASAVVCGTPVCVTHATGALLGGALGDTVSSELEHELDRADDRAELMRRAK